MLDLLFSGYNRTRYIWGKRNHCRNPLGKSICHLPFANFFHLRLLLHRQGEPQSSCIGIPFNLFLYFTPSSSVRYWALRPWRPTSQHSGDHHCCLWCSARVFYSKPLSSQMTDRHPPVPLQCAPTFNSHLFIFCAQLSYLVYDSFWTFDYMFTFFLYKINLDLKECPCLLYRHST